MLQRVKLLPSQAVPSCPGLTLSCIVPLAKSEWEGNMYLSVSRNGHTHSQHSISAVWLVFVRDWRNIQCCLSTKAAPCPQCSWGSRIHHHPPGRWEQGDDGYHGDKHPLQHWGRTKLVVWLLRLFCYILHLQFWGLFSMDRFFLQYVLISLNSKVSLFSRFSIRNALWSFCCLLWGLLHSNYPKRWKSCLLNKSCLSTSTSKVFQGITN